MAKVICIGCGTMGSQLIQAFIDDGHDVTVVNRTQAKAEPYVAQGAQYYPTLSQAARQMDADMIVINVSDYDVSRALIDAAPEAVCGKIVVNLSTGTAEKATAFGERVTALGGKFICGVLTCYPKNIGPHKDGSVVFAGDRESYDKVKAVLAALSPMNFFIGTDPALASVFDTAWLTPHYGLYWGMIQGAASCKAAGIDTALYADAIKVMITALLDVICPNIKRMIAADAYNEAGDCTTDVQAAAMGEIVNGLECSGFDAGPLKCIHDLAEKAVAGGDGDKNIEVMAKYLRR